jgi:hypothetical protein
VVRRVPETALEQGAGTVSEPAVAQVGSETLVEVTATLLPAP